MYDYEATKKTKVYDYTATNIFDTVKRIIRRRWVHLLIIFLINISITGLSYYIYFDKYQTFQLALNSDDYDLLWQALELDYILILISSVILTFIVYGVITKISLEAIIPLDEDSRSTFKKFMHFLYGYILYYVLILFCVLIFSFVSFIFIMIHPLLVVLVLLFAFGFLGAILYISGYYRYIPIIGFLEGHKMLFTKSKNYIYGHLGISIGYGILFSIFINIPTRIADYTTESGYVIATIIISFIVLIFSYLFILFDIAFVINGYYRKKTNQKIKEEQESKLLETNYSFDEE